MARGIITIENNEQMVIPLSLIQGDSRGVSIRLNKKSAIVPDEYLVEVIQALFGVKDMALHGHSTKKKRRSKKATKKKRPS